MIRLIQIACVVILVAVLFAFRQGFYALAGLFDGVGFPVGFICGGFLVAILWVINDRMDASAARADKASAKHQRFRD